MISCNLASAQRGGQIANKTHTPSAGERNTKMAINTTKLYLNANEVAELLNISVPTSYKLIQQMNKELHSQNKIVIHGRIPVAYLETKMYGGIGNGR